MRGRSRSNVEGWEEVTGGEPEQQIAALQAAGRHRMARSDSTPGSSPGTASTETGALPIGWLNVRFNSCKHTFRLCELEDT